MSSGMIRITVLVENTAQGRGLWAEHGLAYWIDTGEQKILFDTGQSGTILEHNAARLGLSLSDVSVIAISHGHYDHTGGLVTAAEAAAEAPIYAHPACWREKYSRRSYGALAAGWPDLQTERGCGLASRRVDVEGPTEIAPGVWLTGAIQRVVAYEPLEEQFYLDSSMQTPDPLLDDQALYFDTPEGVVVLTSCAHSGIINTLKTIQKQTDNRPICRLIGGMHMERAGIERTMATIDALQDIGVQQIAPLHCTGSAVTRMLWANLPGQVEELRVGDTVRVEWA